MAIDIVATWKLRIFNDCLLLRTAMLDVMRALACAQPLATPKIKIQTRISENNFRNFKTSGRCVELSLSPTSL